MNVLSPFGVTAHSWFLAVNKTEYNRGVSLSKERVSFSLNNKKVTKLTMLNL